MSNLWKELQAAKRREVTEAHGYRAPHEQSWNNNDAWAQVCMYWKLLHKS